MMRAMLEKSLHRANIVAAFATLADLAGAGGVTAVIRAALSGVALSKIADNDQRALAQRMATAIDAYFAATAPSADRRAILGQMLARTELTAEALVQGNLNPATVARNLRERMAATAKDPEHKSLDTLAAFEALLCATLTPILSDPATAPQTQQAVNREMLERTDEQTRLLETILASTQRDPRLTEATFIELARRITDDASDFDTALRELERAVAVAIRVQEDGARGSNLGDFVDEVLRRAAELAAVSDFDGAGSEIDAALAREEAESTARRLRLLDAGLEQAILARDAARAADRVAARIALEVPDPAAQFGALRAEQDRWYARGNKQGLNFDLEVAIALARAALARAGDADQRGTAQNNLGNALRTLGEREAGTERLEAAVAAYRAALEEYTRDRVPLQWAAVQMNLGTALLTLGEREAGTERLEEAVVAYRAALQEYTRDRVPLGWAMAQMNLGIALQALGAREAGTGRLEAAVAAYRAALEEFLRDRVPLDWARTQSNLGNALRTLGEREAGTDRLEEAVAAFRAALKEWTRDRVPLQWAGTQNNLGVALRTLGEREAGTERLEAAVAAHRAALEEFTRDRVPLDWAGTQMTLGNALQNLGEREGGTDRLEEAVVAHRAALEEFTRDRVPLQWAATQMNLGNALAILGGREAGTERLEKAVTAYRAALEEWTRDRLPLQWATVQGNLANVDLAFFDKTGDAAHLDRAEGHARDARAVFSEAGASQYLAITDQILGAIAARRGG
jgi:tetratricopeptide (TPR) repeat protein